MMRVMLQKMKHEARTFCSAGKGWCGRPVVLLGWQSPLEQERGRHRRMCPPAPHPLPSCRQLPRTPLTHLAASATRPLRRLRYLARDRERLRLL